MTPSSSRPITLRRACQTCARGKRRCDRRWPRCSRCQRLRINCEYINVPLTMDTASMPLIGTEGVLPSCHKVPPTAFRSIPQHLNVEILKDYEQRIISLLVTGVSSLPFSFAQNMRTHFIHPELWSQDTSVLPPVVIRDIPTVCQLYAQSDHTPILVPLLRQILASHHRRISNHTNFEDLLATAQAFLLAQCMLLATEDPSMPYSETTSTMLLALGQKLWQQAPVQLPSTLSPRWAWLFAESVRRTIIFSFMLRGIYSLKKRNYSVRTPFVDSLPFDIRTALWVACGDAHIEAGSNPDSIVSLHQYSDMLEKGIVHGIPAFGGLVLAACRGETVEEVPYPSLAV
ncbi:hypothetical protein BDW62DRAFT_220883 [Aspergillus aurantiobrunneus]